MVDLTIHERVYCGECGRCIGELHAGWNIETDDPYSAAYILCKECWEKVHK